MTTAPSDSRRANLGASAIATAWVGLSDRFRIITRRARRRFEDRDWAGVSADHVERLDLYNRVAAEVADDVRELLAERVDDRMVWASMKAVYSSYNQVRPDWELGETFFNSVTRRIFTTVGVDPSIEFVDTDFDAPPVDELPTVVRPVPGPLSCEQAASVFMHQPGFSKGFHDFEGDLALASERIAARLEGLGVGNTVDRVEVVSAAFYRGKAANAVGRLVVAGRTVPVAFVFRHPPEGITLDAVLLTENDLSKLFSFTRSYFAVDVESAYPLVLFLSELMPRKRIAELYIAVGQTKHGKTELYRGIRHHLATTEDRFEVAEGTVGLVMVVFVLAGFDVVFKVIRDRFGAPKQTTRDRVRNRYRLVFRHDRAGRLVDAQEYEHLVFDRSKFAPELLEVLLEACARSITVDEDTVTIKHAYVERRVTPLDVYLANNGRAERREAIDDYGQAIKDLAASGIFPGDMLLKNFGVTRHGRVVFYDYDELTTLEECTFRHIPQSQDPLDDMAAEPWFPTGAGDVFPEEFEAFLGMDADLGDYFTARHGDIYDAEAWKEWQRRVAEGEIIEIFPYGDETRIREVGSP